MNRRQVTIASCLSLAFGLLASGCAESSSALPGLSEAPQGPLQLKYEELSEPVVTYLSEERTLDELVATWESVSGESCSSEVFGEAADPTGRNCSDDSIVLVYDSTSDLMQELESVAEFYELEHLENHRLVGVTWAISGEPEFLKELHQELGGVQVALGR